jgi:hypothetical protein
MIALTRTHVRPRLGEGGLNLCELGPRYRMGSHARIFFPRSEFWTIKQ